MPLLVLLFLGCVNPRSPDQDVGEASDSGIDVSPPPSGPDLRLPHLCYPHPADPADEERCHFMMKDMLAGGYGEEMRQEAIRVIQANR